MLDKIARTTKTLVIITDNLFTFFFASSESEDGVEPLGPRLWSKLLKKSIMALINLNTTLY